MARKPESAQDRRHTLSRSSGPPHPFPSVTGAPRSAPGSQGRPNPSRDGLGALCRPLPPLNQLGLQGAGRGGRGWRRGEGRGRPPPRSAPEGPGPPGRGPFAAVPGALVHLGPRLQLELVPGEEEGAVHVRVSGGPERRRRPQPHLHLPQVGPLGFWGPELPTPWPPPRDSPWPDPWPLRWPANRKEQCETRTLLLRPAGTPGCYSYTSPREWGPSRDPRLALGRGDPPAPAVHGAGWWPLHRGQLVCGLARTRPRLRGGGPRTLSLGHWICFGADLQAPPCPPHNGISSGRAHTG